MTLLQCTLIVLGVTGLVSGIAFVWAKISDWIVENDKDIEHIKTTVFVALFLIALIAVMYRLTN